MHGVEVEVESEVLDLLRGADQRSKVSSPADTKLEPVAMMKMPAMVYHGLAGRFVDVLENSTEAPREFRLAVFLTVIGALIGRHAWVTYARPTFPNLFTLLIGQTASARKTTVMAFALDLMLNVVEHTQEKVKALYGLASVEGLAAAMKDGDSLDPYRIVVIEDELKSLLRKAQQKGVSNLIPRLTELYNCGRSFEVNTKTEKAIIKNPFASIVSASTPAWFAESIGESEISGGFLNRWTMFAGESESLIPFPAAPDPATWESIVDDATSAVRQARGDCALSGEARDLFTEFYRTLHNRKDEGLRTEATARTDLHAIKYALIFAVLDRKCTIDADDMSRGVALATFNLEVALSVIGSVGFSQMGNNEKKLQAILRNGRISTRDAMRHLHLSADELNKISRALERVGEIEIVTETTLAGRRRVFLEAIT